MSEYVHPELLAETEWLAENLEAPGLRIVDCDEAPAYQRAHIPGAVGFKVHQFLKDPDNPNHVVTASQFEQIMGEMGIGNDTAVVAYDASRGLNAARFWWVLDRYGHTNTKVVNGGWNKWLAEGRSVTTRVPQVSPARFQAKGNESFLCGLEDILRAQSRDDAVIWDVRSEGEYTGEAQRQNKRGGHILGAAHLEWVNLVTDDELRVWKSPDELRRMLEAKGITPEKEVLVH